MRLRRKLTDVLVGCSVTVGLCLPGCGEDPTGPAPARAASGPTPVWGAPGAPPQDAPPDSAPVNARLIQVIEVAIHFGWTNAAYVAANGRDLPDTLDINGDGVVDIVDLVTVAVRSSPTKTYKRPMAVV